MKTSPSRAHLPLARRLLAALARLSTFGAAAFLAGCAVAPPSPRTSAAGGHRIAGSFAPESATASRRAADERPGLGTSWGEERESRVGRTAFVRGNGNEPAATDRLFYNDRSGVEAMLAHAGGSERRASGLSSMAGGLVSIGLREEGGGWLESWWAGGNRFVAGERGQRYEIVVRNDTRDRAEVVLSVDGLDVMDGRAASFKKRGYIVHSGDTLVVDGFRTSASSVAAFRFGRVSRSYAALKHGDTRNVGVIGVAVFTEREPEVWRRRGANPFPGSRWATPPE